MDFMYAIMLSSCLGFRLTENDSYVDEAQDNLLIDALGEAHSRSYYCHS